ncbi:hypothetical protein MKX62_04425 [Sporosarcina sp. FSL K6-5500]
MATAAVVKAEGSKTQVDIDAAQDLIAPFWMFPDRSSRYLQLSIKRM